MSIVDNRKAYHDYFVEEKFEAGLALEGWEVKAIRAGRAQLKEAYVDRQGRRDRADRRACHAAADGIDARHPDPTRTRKLLLHRSEINRLVGQVERAGYTLVPLNLHYSKRPDQARDRPGEGQEAIRQARDREAARLEPREAAAAAQPDRAAAAGHDARRVRIVAVRPATEATSTHRRPSMPTHVAYGHRRRWNSTPPTRRGNAARASVTRRRRAATRISSPSATARRRRLCRMRADFVRGRLIGYTIEDSVYVAAAAQAQGHWPRAARRADRCAAQRAGCAADDRGHRRQRQTSPRSACTRRSASSQVGRLPATRLEIRPLARCAS